MLILFVLQLLLETVHATLHSPLSLGMAVPLSTNPLRPAPCSCSPKLTIARLLLVPPPPPAPRVKSQGDSFGEPGVAGGVVGVEEAVGEG